MQIVTLNSELIPQILELESTTDPYYVKTTEEELSFIFSHPKTRTALGVFDGDKLIAWGTFFTEYGNATNGAYEIFVVFIAKAHRGKGIGETLLKELIKRIQTTQDYKKIYLVTSPHNIPALFLYLKSGFIITDYKKDYFGPGKDRVLLTYSK